MEVEWKDGKPTPTNKTLTKRGHVSIFPHEAEINNQYFPKTKLFYELAEEPVIEKSEVRKQADELGIKYKDNISDEKLQEKIDEFLNK